MRQYLNKEERRMAGDLRDYDIIKSFHRHHRILLYIQGERVEWRVEELGDKWMNDNPKFSGTSSTIMDATRAAKDSIDNYWEKQGL